jgi:capsular polysaccharide biosynthesis protein
MDYINTFRFLNPHLFVSVAPSIDCKNVYRCKRNPPTIARFREEIIGKCKEIYGFTDTWFLTSHHIYYPKHIVRKVEKEGPPIINAYTFWGNGYYHFLTEVLPSVLELSKEPYTIYCMPSKFTVPVFRWFGIENDVEFAKPPINQTTFEQPYIECGNPSLQKIGLIRNIVKKKLKDKFEKTKGILIYRRESSRQILNHDDLLKCLVNAFPYLEWITFDTLPFSETADLFAQAAIIVGPHGAGLTNMLFSENCKIYEFVPLEKPNVCYWHLSELLGHQYTMIPCRTNMPNFCFNIDIDEIKQFLCVLN